MTAGCDEDLLASVIDEVIYWLDADGEIPLGGGAAGAGWRGGGVPGVCPLGRYRDHRCGAEGSLPA